MSINDLQFDKKGDFEEKFKWHMRMSSNPSHNSELLKNHLEMAMLTRQIMTKNAILEQIEKLPETATELAIEVVKSALKSKDTNMSDVDEIMKDILNKAKDERE